MNVFRALRNLWNTVALREDQSPGAGGKKRERSAQTRSPEDRAGLFRDGFERVAGRIRGVARTLYRPGREPLGKDGFEAGFRGAPVDLTGGVKVPYLGVEVAPMPTAPVASDFVASLDVLALLIEPMNVEGGVGTKLEDIDVSINGERVALLHYERAVERSSSSADNILGMDYIATRLRNISATGGAEVDLIFHSSRLVYSRWQVQCKNTARVALDDVAKEVGLTHFLKSNVIVMVSTGDCFMNKFFLYHKPINFKCIYNCLSR